MKINRNLRCKCGKLQIDHEDVKKLIKMGVLEVDSEVTVNDRNGYEIKHDSWYSRFKKKN